MDHPVLSGSKLISQTILAAKRDQANFFIGRLGSVELEVILAYSGQKVVQSSKPLWRLRKEAWISAGIWPPLNFQFKEFTHQYSAAIEKVTVMAEWGNNQLFGEDMVINSKCANSARIPLGSLDPVLIAAIGGKPWTLELEGKKVLVISSFSREIRSQVSKNRELHNLNLLPKLSLETLAAPQTNGLSISNRTWSQEMMKFKQLVDAKMNGFSPDVVLVAAGAYGMPISSYIFEKGMSVIYVGGALQLIFGIWGNRWRTNPNVLRMANSNWIWPDKQSRPFGSFLVERSSYW